MRQRSAIVAGLMAAPALASGCSGAGSAAFPATPPAPLPVHVVAFPPFFQRTLANGARVVVVPNHEQPVVSVRLDVGSGSAADPAGKPGVAAATADLLTKGTVGRSAAEIAETIEFMGSEISTAAVEDWTGITMTVTSQYLDQGLALMADVVVHPTFPDAELELWRKRTLSSLDVELGEPATLASRRFMKEVYGEHPYGAAMTPESVGAISRDAVLRFHDLFYRASNVLIVVAGDVEPEAVAAKLDRYFAELAAGPVPSPALPLPPSQPRRRLVFVNKPGSVQAVFRVGHLMPSASQGDWVGIGVMNYVLGGRGESWLFRVLRSERGYTYGAYSSARERRQRGFFQARTEVRNEVADSALAVLLELLQRIRTTPVPAADLAAAQSYLAGSFPFTIETPGQVADQLATTLLLGRPASYQENLRSRIAATTLADVQRVAREYLHPDGLVIVVVGDARQVLRKLRPFADTVEVYDERGRRIAPDG